MASAHNNKIFIDGKMTETRLDDGDFRVVVAGSKENGDYHQSMMVLSEEEYLSMKARIRSDLKAAGKSGSA